MSRRILRNIEMELTPQSIDRAIRDIDDLIEQMEDMVEELIQDLVYEGIRIARMQIVQMDAVMTDMLEQSIQGVYFSEERCGVIYTDRPYALFVEFGTGAVGANETQHPEHGRIGWEHDVHQHGMHGWWYPADFGWWIPRKGKYAGQPMAWTAGQPARPFLYSTLRALEEIAPERMSEKLTEM